MTLTDELNRRVRFDKLKQHAAKNLNPAEQERYRDILKEFRQKILTEKKRHREEYHTRISGWRKKLIDEAGSKKPMFKPPWASNDGFDKAHIEKRAQQMVEAFHFQNIATIKDWRNNKIDELVRHCEKRRQRKEQPKNDFNQVSDRRQAKKDRRRPKQRKAVPARRQITYQS